MADTIFAEVLYRPLTDSLRFLPEGPYPCGPNQFSWVAIQHGVDAKVGSLNLFDLSTRINRSYALPGRPGFAFVTDEPHRFVVGCERSIGIFDVRDASWETFVEGVDSAVQGTIINDGLTWEGNLLFGTKDLEFKTKKAGLYLWRAADRCLIQLRDDQVCSNGKAILQTDGQMGRSGDQPTTLGDQPTTSARQLHLLDIDTPTRQVVRYALNLEAGTLGPREVVLDFKGDPAVPDGMILTPDSQSAIVSFYNPNPADHGETRQYRIADGQLERVWITPGSPQATCPQLVQFDDRVTLIITTAVECMPTERRQNSPNAGSLFYAHTDFPNASDAPRFNPR